MLENEVIVCNRITIRIAIELLSEALDSWWRYTA